MAYQNVGTPRFYIDYGQYQIAQGLVHPDMTDNQIKALQLNPTELKNIDSFEIELPWIVQNYTSTNYIAILGHLETGDDFGYQNPRINEDGLQGWSLFVSQDESTISFDYPNPIGALSVGHYFDMPNSPDLSLSLTREYDGVKQVKTRGGATLSNATYTSPPKWGDLPAWQIGESGFSRTGRRVWDLSFSYISDSDLMGENEMSSTYKENDITIGNTGFATTLENSNDFFSQVIQKTLGGHLSFILQINKDNFQPDQFALARLDMSSFKLTQKANNVYNIKLKIRESW